MGGRVQVRKEGIPVEGRPGGKYESPGLVGGRSSMGEKIEVEQETGYTEAINRVSNLVRIMGAGFLTVGEESCKY